MMSSEESENSADRFRFLHEAISELSGVAEDHEVRLSKLEHTSQVSQCAQAEEICGRQNCDALNRFIVQGGPYLALGDDIQDRLKAQVTSYIKAMGNKLPTDVVHVRQYKSKTGSTYDVEMGSVNSSNQVRRAYGSYWASSSKKAIPPALNNISISISHTPATRIRVRMMKEMVKRHLAANPDSNLKMFVNNYEPRPVIKLKAQKSAMKTYSFVEAVQSFGHLLSPEFLTATTKAAIGAVSKSKVVSTFLLLNPDFVNDNPNANTPVKTVAAGASEAGGVESAPEEEDVLVNTQTKGVKRGRKTVPGSSKRANTTTTTVTADIEAIALADDSRID